MDWRGNCKNLISWAIAVCFQAFCEDVVLSRYEVLPCLQILSNTGNWFNYVATLLVVEKLANGRGIYLSIVLVIHFLPSFILFPIAGVLADR